MLARIVRTDHDFRCLPVRLYRETEARSVPADAE